MDHFTYRNGTMHAEDVALADIAKKVGTPFYCYSRATLVHHAKVFTNALQAINPLVCFAVKANSNIAVLHVLAQQGLGADVVSEGELRRALKAGIDPQKIVFSGVGKSAAEMKFALEQKILQFNVESDRELLTLNDVAKEMGVYAKVALRVNPDVDADTHAKISTGKKESKFGIDIEVAPAIFAQAKSLPNIMLEGISVHIGSQLTSLAPFRVAYIRVRELVEQLKAQGISLRTIDLGGGLGVPYANADTPPSPQEYGALVSEIFVGTSAQFIVEPGRLIAGNAGVLVSRIERIKRAQRNYVIINAGMNDLMRPALYDARHDTLPVIEPKDTKTFIADVVGPVCESSDVFGRSVTLPVLRENDLVVMRTAGAYGASMSSSYNSRLLIPEVLVDGAAFHIIRQRPTYEQMLELEEIPA